MKHSNDSIKNISGSVINTGAVHGSISNASSIKSPIQSLIEQALLRLHQYGDMLSTKSFPDETKQQLITKIISIEKQLHSPMPQMSVIQEELDYIYSVIQETIKDKE